MTFITMRRLIWLLAFCMTFLPLSSWAKSAEVMLFPTRVVLEKNEHFAKVIVKNAGNAAGDYTVNLADMKMQENGAVVAYAKTEAPQFSALSFLHAAPSSMSLVPGETQDIHIIVHPPENLEPGEYRAHLQVHLVHPNIDEAAAAPAQKGIVVKPDIVFSIPIIIRVGTPQLTIGIEQAKLARDARGKPEVDLVLTRQGNISSMGDIAVNCGQRQIKLFAGQAVYRPLARRSVAVPLDETPAGVDPSACALTVAYKAQKDHGGKTLAEAPVSP
jgi:hypothetical protein